MDRASFNASPKVTKATGEHGVVNVYDDQSLLAVLRAISADGLTGSKLNRLRLGLDSAAMWFRSFADSKTAVIKVRTISTLEKIAKAADRVRLQALAMDGDGIGGFAGANIPSTRRSPQRYRERLDALNDLLGQGPHCDEDAALAFLEGPIAGGLTLGLAGDASELEALRRTLSANPDDYAAIAEAASVLALAAHDAARRLAKMRQSMIRPGHSGDGAMNGWIDDMLNLYCEVTGREIAVSVGAPGTANAGLASGPLIRFLMAAFAPIAAYLADAGRLVPDLHEDAWASRIRTAQRAAETAKASTREAS